MRTCERCEEADESVRARQLCSYCASTPSCWLTLTLPRRMRAALTGYSTRAVHALAHLRDAWCSADDDNRRAVVACVVALRKGHSLRDVPSIVAHVLVSGLDDGVAAELLLAVGFTESMVRHTLDERDSEGWLSS